MGAAGRCVACERHASCKHVRLERGAGYLVKGSDGALSCIDVIANRIHRDARTILVSGARPLKAI